MRKKVKPVYATNEIGAQFDIASLQEHLNKYNSWVLGFHLLRNPHMNIIDRCTRDLLEAMDGKVPYNFVDGCGWIQPTKAWIEHQWKVKLSVDYIWDGIRKDSPDELTKCDLKGIRNSIYKNCNWKQKKHWWNIQ